MHNLIGNTAGHIWEYLDKHGPSPAIKIKAALGITNTQLYLALGWLAREDKIEMVAFEHTYKIFLKR
ncbi:MAG: winged helix-turn-helix domain-containing protein [Endomicrobiales bacterium]